MAVVRVTKKGQITLPEDVRQEKEIEPGHLVSVDLEKDQIVVRKLATDIVTQTAGLWAGKAIGDYRRERTRADARRRKRGIL
jgi:AbrB family looped-hinge helix DNA binding protein